MFFRTLRVRALGLAGLLGIGLLAGQVQAAGNWEVGKTQYGTVNSPPNGICVNCHNANTTQSLPGYPAVSSLGGSASYLQGRFNAGASVGSQMGNPHTNTLRTANNGATAPIDDTVSDIAAYIANPNFPTATVSPTSRAYGSVSIFSTSSQSFTLTNGGTGSLTVSGASLDDNTNYDITANNCGTVTANGGTCSITVRFKPQTANSFNGRTLTISHDALGGSSTVSLSGTGYDPTPIYSTAGFGALAGGFSAATDSSKTICPTITNSVGTGNTLTVSLSVVQSGSTDYSNYYELDNLSACPGGGAGLAALCAPPGGSVTGGTSLAAGASCTLALKFNPGKFGFAGGTGARPATLRVAHNAANVTTPASYTVGGVATAGPEPQIGISTNPSANSDGQVLPAAFSHQVVDTTSASWNEFLVSNSGTADGLDITAVTWTNHTEFGLSENCVAAPPLARLAGGSPTCTIALAFTPQPAPSGLGQRCTIVTIQAAFSSNGDQSVTVCGTGVPVPVPQMDVTPGSIAFGNRSIGALYQPVSVVISNGVGATLDLQVGAVALSGNGFAFVPDASTCQNKSLAAGTSCTLQLQFTPDPGAPGTSYSANLTVDSNDPTTPHRVVPLTATAVASAVPVLQWQSTPNVLTFPDLVIAGQQAAQPLVAHLLSVGPGAVDVQAVRLVGADAANFSITSCPALLYEGESCALNVRFLPGSGGTKTAQIEVVTAGGVAPTVLTVQGRGVGGSSPYLIVSAETLSFGDVRVGARSAPLELRLSAGGDGVLTVTGITADVPFSVASQTCPALPFTLPLGADCSIAVTFAPTAVGDTPTTLRIATDNGARPVEISLDGNGQKKADVSGGGCTLARGDPRTDPTLWLLVLLAAGVLWKRRNGPKR